VFKALCNVLGIIPLTQQLLSKGAAMKCFHYHHTVYEKRNGIYDFIMVVPLELKGN
jgi:hypothetical protein